MRVLAAAVWLSVLLTAACSNNRVPRVTRPRAPPTVMPTVTAEQMLLGRPALLAVRDAIGLLILVLAQTVPEATPAASTLPGGARFSTVGQAQRYVSFVIRQPPASVLPEGFSIESVGVSIDGDGRKMVVLLYAPAPLSSSFFDVMESDVDLYAGSMLFTQTATVGSVPVALSPGALTASLAAVMAKWQDQGIWFVLTFYHYPGGRCMTSVSDSCAAESAERELLNIAQSLLETGDTG